MMPSVGIYMDGPGDHHSKWSQSAKDRYHTTYMWNLKKGYKWAYLQHRNTVRLGEKTYGYQRGKG